MVTVLAAAGAAGGYYISKSRQYETVFFPHTVINGIDVSHKTAEEVKALIAAGIEEYQLSIRLRGNDTETISPEEIDLHSVFDGSLEEYLDAQEPMRWWQHRSKQTEYEISAMIVFDEEKLQKKLDSLVCFSEEYAREPKDAYISEYQSGQGYVVIPEEQGNLLDREMATAAIEEAIHNLRTEVSLEDAGAYVEPEVTAEDEELNALAARLNQYVGVTVTYRFGDKQEIVDGDLISQWISVGEDQNVYLSAEQVEAYVKQLASQYDTAYKKKSFKTSYGKTVTVSPAIYGWRINRGKEAEALYDIIQSGESQTREPIYSQTANSRGVNDYGDTYVEINLTAQHLFFYKDGKLIVESDFVSGSHAKGYDTPAGAYPLTYKERNATLRGENYETPVSYWMPFNGNIGMHDADWRSSFGGQIYMTNGSHGCINLPPAAAKKIYENIFAGAPVICYHLEGTETGKSSKAQSGQTAGITAAGEDVTATSGEGLAATGGSSSESGGESAISGENAAEKETTAAGTPVGPGESTSSPAGPGESASGAAGPGESSSGAAGPGESVSGAAGPGESSSGGAAGPGESASGAAGPGGSRSDGAGANGPGGASQENKGANGPGNTTPGPEEPYGPGNPPPQ